MVKTVCDNRTLQKGLKQCTSDRFRTRKRDAPNILFEVLGYGPLLCRNGVVEGIIV